MAELADSTDSGSEPPKVFVSYAHENRDHKNWVKSLATDLRKNGVEALLDEWRVDLGEDLTLHMDKIRVCDRVLLVCTPAYARKSNEGEGGVGYERSVITAELAKQIVTSKFVCILRAGSEGEALPTFAQKRRYIDFRDDSEYDVQLGRLLRSLHDAPADPEPPLGANPFRGGQTPVSSSVERSVSSHGLSEMDPEQIAEKAELLLSRKDMLGWKRLVRRARRELQPRLAAWRDDIGASDKSLTEDAWRQCFDKGIEACEPLLVLALTAVDSEIDSVRDQHALLDDLLNIDGWVMAGANRVIYMPQALAYIYHHVLGAFFIESNRHTDAIHLLTRSIRDPYDPKTRPVWNDHHLMGWVEPLGHDCVVSWRYMCRFHAAKSWMKLFFHSQKSFIDSYRAYGMLASMIELSAFLGKDGATEKLRQDLWLDVPPTFLRAPCEGDCASQGIQEIVDKAIPDRSTLNFIAQAGGAGIEEVRDAFPAWWKQWVRALAQMPPLLADDVTRFGAPQLPR